MTTLKLIRIGKGLGVALPDEVLERWKLQRGDAVLLAEVADGVLLMPQITEFDRQLAVGRRIAKERRKVLRDLADK